MTRGQAEAAEVFRETNATTIATVIIARRHGLHAAVPQRGAFSGIGFAAAQDVINAAGFGTTVQTLRRRRDLQQHGWIYLS
jgi:hypothetical protein